MKKSILVLGATSGIAKEVLRCAAGAHWSAILVARDQDKLNELQADLLNRGCQDVETFCVDLAKDAEKFWSKFHSLDLDITHALIAYGILTDQEKSEQDTDYAIDSIETNALSVIRHLIELANYFEKKNSGHISVISSVAGDRGRKSNYTYGASKAFLSRYLEGLQNRLHDSGVKVLDIKPGFVGTPMTEHLEKRPLEADVVEVGKSIFSNLVNEKEGVSYVPKKWFPVMTVIKAIPSPIFKRLSL